MSVPATLPQLLRRNAVTMARRAAMREKDRGIWQTYTWAQCAANVGEFALGLAAAGIGRGAKLSVIGDNRPRLYWAQLAVQCLGGIAVPVYQDAIAAELVYVLNHAEVAVIVAEDQEQVDKVLSLVDRLPSLKLLVYDDPRGLERYDHPFLKSFAAIQEAGREFGAPHPDYLDTEISRGSGEDLALLAYTSGTTGHPKGAMLSHANLLSAAAAFAAAEDIRPTDEWLSYLPMAWVGDSLYSTVLSLSVGFACNCPESPESVQRDLRELGPTALVAPPRIWENMLASVHVRAADATPLKRHIFDFFRRVAEEAELRRSDGKRVPLGMRLGLLVGEYLVYAPVRDRLGLRRARWAYTGGAPLGADAYRFFRSFGVNLKQIYGVTELSGLAALQPDGESGPDTVGRPCPGMEVRIDADGEVLIRSGGVFKGYYNQPESTAAAVLPEGWFRTGDAGFLDPRGHLVIVDRAKDVGKLADGSVFAPQFVENKLKFSPFIAEAVAFGHERPFVAAMIAIDAGTVGNWAERRGLPYTSFQDLSAKPAVRALIREEIRKCNNGLPEAARVRRFLLLTKALEADDAEVTRTRKIRRRFVAEKYAAVVDAFYGAASEVELEIEITYDDGRGDRIRSVVPIEEAEAPSVVSRAPELAHA